MTVTDPATAGPSSSPPSSLGTAAARRLASTTKTVPQMRGISSRWLSRVLPWVETHGAVYRVNRRLTYLLGDGRIDVNTLGQQPRIIPGELAEIAALRPLRDSPLLSAVADRFVVREYEPGEAIVQAGTDVHDLVVIAHGRATKSVSGEYGAESVVDVLGDGDFFGDGILTRPAHDWPYTVRATTFCTTLALSRTDFQELLDREPRLRDQLDQNSAEPTPATNKHGEAAIDLAAGHVGEPELPATYVDYELTPREYHLQVAQTVLRVHTRVMDLYNEPTNQLAQQLRLTVEALRERQEDELFNNPDFGLLHNANLKQRIRTSGGPPTPADLDELLSRRRRTTCFLAHPRAIAAFGRECTRRGLYPDTVETHGRRVHAWRGVPILPSDKIPISETSTSSILAIRTGEDDQGVVGLHQTGLPDEIQSGVSARFTGIDQRAVVSYLVSTYHSAAVMVPDALGLLENVQLG